MARICPICGNKYNGYPAISRDDNETEICPDCGRMEAIRDYLRWKDTIKDVDRPKSRDDYIIKDPSFKE